MFLKMSKTYWYHTKYNRTNRNAGIHLLYPLARFPDTNVLVSILLFGGYAESPPRIVKARRLRSSAPVGMPERMEEKEVVGMMNTCEIFFLTLLLRFRSYQRIQSLTVKNAQEFKRRSGRMLISDFPLLNGRKAGIENRRHHSLAKSITLPQGTNLFRRIRRNRFDTQNVIFTDRTFIYKPEFMQILSCFMNRFQNAAFMRFSLHVRPPPTNPPLWHLQFVPPLETAKMGTLDKLLQDAGFDQTQEILCVKKELVGFTPIEVVV